MTDVEQPSDACLIAVHPRGLRVLAVGGGAVAARKLAPFLAAGARVRVVAPEISAALSVELERHGATIERRAYAAGDVADAQLVFAATASPAVNARVAAEATALSRIVNVADDAATSTFSSAAQFQRGPLAVGVYAGGAPDVARRVRDAVAERIGPEYGDAAARLRDMRRTALDRDDRASWDRARRELAGADFCATVDAGTFGDRADSWR